MFYGIVIPGKVKTRSPVYEEAVREAWLNMYGNKKAEGPLEMEITTAFAPPENAPGIQRRMMLTDEILYVKKPDAFEIAKTIHRALDGAAYTNASQIVRMSVVKMYDADPYTQITIHEL